MTSVAFLMLVVAAKNLNLWAVFVFGPEVLLLALGIVGNKRGGGFEDDLGGTVILLQQNDLGIGIKLLEFQNVIDVCAAPAVDRLVRVAGGTDIFVIHGKHVGEDKLGVVGVLILIDKDVLKSLLKLLADFLIITKHDRHLKKQIIKIDSLIFGKNLLVTDIGSRDVLFKKAARSLRQKQPAFAIYFWRC